MEKVRLTKVRLNKGGYDSYGQYFGVGQTLWCFIDGDYEERFVRADDRDGAKDKIRKMDSGAKFYR